MVTRLPLAPSVTLDDALATARARPEAATHLASSVRALEQALEVDLEEAGPHVERAFRHLDAYLAALLSLSGLSPSCRARCSSCCHDAPVATPLEALRVARVLALRDDAEARFRVAAEHAEELRGLLMDALLHGGTQGRGQDAYREAHLAFRKRNHRCAALGDDDLCLAYEARPLACRTFLSLDDPHDCRLESPRFTELRRPPMWAGEQEIRVVELLVAIGRKNGLPHAPNLPWGLAAMRDSALVARREG